MPKCEECGSENMIIKSKDGRYLCFDHYQQYTNISDSEMESLINEYYDEHLEYVDEVYKKKIRKLQGKRKK
jgi:hypothetical protein